MNQSILTKEDTDGLLGVAEGMGKVAANLHKTDPDRFAKEVKLLALASAYLLMLTEGPCDCAECRRDAAQRN